MLLMYVPILKKIGYYIAIFTLPLGTILLILLYWKDYLRGIKERKDCWLYILFCFFYLITIIVNINYNVIQNSKALLWLIIYFFVGYMWHELPILNYMKKVIVINRWYISFSCIVTLIGDILLFVDRNFSEYFNGIPIGVVSGRLFGVFLELNSGCIIIICSMLSSFINIYLEYSLNEKTKIWHGLYAINFAAGYLFLLAAKSRTATISFSCAITIIACTYVYKYFGNKNVLKCLGMYILVAIISFLITYGFFKACQWGVDQIVYQKRFAAISSEQGEVNGNVTTEELTFERTDQMASLHARFDIWDQCINLWKENNVIWGIGAGNMKVYAQKSLNSSNYEKLKGGEYGEATHNMLISLLLYSGIAGSICMICLWAKTLFKSVKCFLKSEVMGQEKIKWIFAGEFGIVVVLLLYGMMFTAIIFSNIFETIFFWWHYGLLNKILNDKSIVLLSGDK